MLQFSKAIAPCAIALLFSIVSFDRAARAGDAPALVPPSLLDESDAPYPDDGRGDATVDLELDVSRDGTVARACATSGEPPFADAAERAARRWRFAPARRDGEPVAARIRIRVSFVAPRAPAADAPAVGTSATAPPPEEVRVAAARPEPAATRLTRTEAREIPGALGDPLRAIAALPGVTPVQSGIPLFFVRGAPPANTGFFLDGVQVPLLFHAGLGPSVVHPSLIDHVDFFPGSAPARYGRAAGGVLAAETRLPAESAHGEASVRVIDASLLAEAPFADGRGAALVAGRFGYPDLILGLVARSTKLDYWDYQSRANWKISDKDEIGLFAFGSHDATSHVDTFDGVPNVQEQLASEFHVADLRFDHAARGGHVRLAATVGTSSMGAAPFYATDVFGGARVEWEQRLSPRILVRGGADARLDAYGTKRDSRNPLDAIVPSSADPPPRNVSWGAHADLVLRPIDAVELVPGARFDLMDSARPTSAASAGASTTVPSVDPRFGARVQLTDRVAWLPTVGLAHQAPLLRVGAAPGGVATVPGFAPGRSQLQTVFQNGQGLELRLPAEFTVTTTAFLDERYGMTDLTKECRAISSGVPGGPPAVTTGYDCADAPVRGRAYGVELSVRRPLTRRISGWLSYTLSRATRDTHLSVDGVDTVARVASEYDRTHVLSAIGAIDLGRRWRLGARAVFYTGTPYGRVAGGSIATYETRFPPYFRADLRLEKRWTLGETGSLAFTLDVQNATLSHEPSSLRCTSATSQSAPVCEVESTSTTIPSIGLEATL